MSAAQRPVPGPLRLIEEATHLLRLAGPSAWLVYLAGSLPFWLAVLYAWALLTKGPAPSVPLLALLLIPWYVGMKAAQARFCSRLLSVRLRSEPARLGLRGWLGLAGRQARVQPHAALLFWLGLGTLAAFPWALAYGQCLSVLSDEPQLARAARRQAAQSPRGYLMTLLILLLFMAVVFANALVACGMLPWLAAHLFGWQSSSSPFGSTIFNGAYLSVSLVCAWLAVDPILKAVFVLRVFYTRSLTTGEDLQVDFRRIVRRAGGWGRTAAVLLAFLLAAAPVRAAATREAGTELNRSIDKMATGSDYDWTRPDPAENVSEPTSPIGRMARGLCQGMEDAGRALRRAADAIGDWISGRKSVDESGHTSSTGGSAPAVHLLVILVGAGALLLAIVMLADGDRRRRVLKSKSDGVETAKPAEGPPALDASRPPAGGWLKLAQELAARGEWRSALRATYLATLARLAEDGLVRLARAKTNLDYERELRRRAAGRLDLVAQFSGRRRQFESVWYGREDAMPEDVQAWIGELEQKVRP
ncbi:MAG TPA: DUF4129 domain-containing protein [Opitutaceae bacterium]|jgi:hypothetical protein